MKLGIVGGSGYTGALLAELLLKHPSVKLAAISSETLAGEPVQQHLPLRTPMVIAHVRRWMCWPSSVFQITSLRLTEAGRML